MLWGTFFLILFLPYLILGPILDSNWHSCLYIGGSIFSTIFIFGTFGWIPYLAFLITLSIILGKQTTRKEKLITSLFSLCFGAISLLIIFAFLIGLYRVIGFICPGILM